MKAAHLSDEICNSSICRSFRHLTIRSTSSDHIIRVIHLSIKPEYLTNVGKLCSCLYERLCLRVLFSDFSPVPSARALSDVRCLWRFAFGCISRCCRSRMFRWDVHSRVKRNSPWISSPNNFRSTARVITCAMSCYIQCSTSGNTWLTRATVEVAFFGCREYR